jgi:uncharacterized protein YlxP (DUF503 family)
VFVGIGKLDLVIGQSHSLKEKRMVLRRIRDRVRDKLGVAIHEVGAQDQWQRAQLGFAVASGDKQQAHAVIDEVVRVIHAAAADGDAQVIAVAKDVMPFDAAPAPVVVVDERTGAGDKALGGDDWIPDAWRDEQ